MFIMKNLELLEAKGLAWAVCHLPHGLPSTAQNDRAVHSVSTPGLFSRGHAWAFPGHYALLGAVAVASRRAYLEAGSGFYTARSHEYSKPSCGRSCRVLLTRPGKKKGFLFLN